MPLLVSTPNIPRLAPAAARLVTKRTGGEDGDFRATPGHASTVQKCHSSKM